LIIVDELRFVSAKLKDGFGKFVASCCYKKGILKVMPSFFGSE